MITNFNNYLSAKQVAEIVGLSVGRLREIARAGEIKFYRPQGRRKMLFSRDDVETYIKGGQVC